MKTAPGAYPLVVTAAYRRSSSNYQLEGPAVCIPLISSTGHGHASMHRVHFQIGKFALADLLVALIPKDRNVCDARYLYYLLTAKKNDYFVPLMKGTANVSLKIPEIAGVEISLPSLSEQRRVVAHTEELSTKIDEVRLLKNSVKSDARRMLLGAFRTLRTAAVERPMEEVAPITRRKVEIRPDDSYLELGIRSFGRGTFHKPGLSGLDVGSKKLFRIAPGDLVFNNVFAWEGAVAVAKPEDEGRVGSHRFITCASKNGVTTPNWLRFYFLTEEGLQKLGEASPGGAGRNRTLGLEALHRIRIPVPAYEKQIWFDNLQSKVDSLNQLQDEIDKELNALFPSILSHTFTGQL